MRILTSMTSILKSWLLDETSEIQLSDLKDGQSMFYFGCSREHLDGIPHEATWCNTELPRVFDRDDMLDEVKCTVHIDQVDKSLHDKLLTFLSLVESADKEGRVKWEVGNYQAKLQKIAAMIVNVTALRESDPVWAFGSWTTLGEYVKL